MDPETTQNRTDQMDFERTGVILFVEHYAECVAFYRDLLGLEVEMEKEGLTRFSFGGAYLMLESGGMSAPPVKEIHENPAVVRFDVENVLASARYLQERNIPVEVSAFEWGVIGIFHDPDGNRCEFKNGD